jgi:hypothetical protein
MTFLAYQPVDNYQTIMLYLRYETFSHHNAWPIHISKLHGLSTTNAYDWITMPYKCKAHLLYVIKTHHKDIHLPCIDSYSYLLNPH